MQCYRILWVGGDEMLEWIAGSVAVAYGIKFLVGRKVTVKEVDGAIVITHGGKDILVPERLLGEVVESMRRIQVERKGPVLPDVIHQEAERLRALFHQRRVVQEAELVKALTELFSSGKAMQLAYEDLRTVAQDKIKLARSKERELKEEEFRIEELEAKKRAMQRQEEREKLELEKLRQEVNGSAQGERDKFNVFGPEDEG